MFRPRTGEVFVFPTWTASAELEVDALMQVVDSDAMVSERARGACPNLAVHTSSGEVVPVRLGELR